MSNITEEQPDPGTLNPYPEGYSNNDPTTGMTEEGLMKKAGFSNMEGPISDHPPLTFGVAISFAKQGHKVARSGWNGKGMWVAYSPGSEALPAAAFWSTANREYAESVGGSVKVLPCLTMKTVTGEIVMGWNATQSDMLADDWMVVE